MAVVLTLSLGLIGIRKFASPELWHRVTLQVHLIMPRRALMDRIRRVHRNLPSLRVSANQLEQMGNNTAFLQGGAAVGKKPNLSQGLSTEQNTTAGPSNTNMTAQKQPGSASSTSNRNQR